MATAVFSNNWKLLDYRAVELITSVCDVYDVAFILFDPFDYIWLRVKLESIKKLHCYDVVWRQLFSVSCLASAVWRENI